MLERKMLVSNPWFVVYEDAPPAPPVSDPPPAPPVSDPPPAPPAPGAITFTDAQQKHIDGIINGKTATHKDQLSKMRDELDALKSRSDLTAEERVSLEERVKSLTSDKLNETEKLKRQLKTIEKDSKTTIDALIIERDTIQKTYETNEIQRAISSAAVSNKAYNPEHIMNILEGKTQLSEEVDAKGEPTGNKVPKVTFQDFNDKDEPITIELTPSQAVKRMTEMVIHQNLFEASGSGGIGGRQGRGSNKATSMEKVLKDPALYRKLRKEKKINFKGEN